MEYLRDLVPADLNLCDGAASFLQSGFWGGFKARFGWESRAFFADWGPGQGRPLLVMRRRLGPGFSFAYVPWGPELPGDLVADANADTNADADADAGKADGTEAGEGRRGALGELARALKAQLPGDTAFVRFDPPWYTEGAGIPPPPVGKPLYRAGADV
ncbi:MAG: hypothetical protein LBQ38_09105, partial [Spirochaetaceae bacterium]|nr:hypothetical protein [Spirochaetaceae bacterium]